MLPSTVECLDVGMVLVFPVVRPRDVGFERTSGATSLDGGDRGHGEGGVGGQFGAIEISRETSSTQIEDEVISQPTTRQTLPATSCCH